MHVIRFSLLAVALLFVSVGHAADRPYTNCVNSRRLHSIVKEAPDYLPSQAVDTLAKRTSIASFNVLRLISAASGDAACVAVLVDENGIPQDVAVYSPARLALLPEERAAMFADRFSPAHKAGIPVKSIVVAAYYFD
ncbi:hypothetical protein [Lysobacter sp. HA35]